MTLKARVLEALPKGSGVGYLSAYQVSIQLGAKWGSVSSILNKLCKTGAVVRVEKQGPKGGFGYYRPVSLDAHQTLWDHLEGS